MVMNSVRALEQSGVFFPPDRRKKKGKKRKSQTETENGNGTLESTAQTEAEGVIIPGNPKDLFFKLLFAECVKTCTMGTMVWSQNTAVAVKNYVDMCNMVDNDVKERGSSRRVWICLLTGDRCERSDWYADGTSSIEVMTLSKMKRFLSSETFSKAECQRHCAAVYAITEQGSFDSPCVDLGICFDFFWRVVIQSAGRCMRTPESLKKPFPLLYLENATNSPGTPYSPKPCLLQQAFHHKNDVTVNNKEYAPPLLDTFKHEHIPKLVELLLSAGDLSAISADINLSVGTLTCADYGLCDPIVE